MPTRQSSRTQTWTRYVYTQPDRSYATRKERAKHLRTFAAALRAQGMDPKPRNLKPKHVEKAVSHWTSQGISRRTICNRLSTIRWLARTLGKPAVVARSNDAYDLPPHDSQPRNPATPLYPDRIPGGNPIEQVISPQVRASLTLQQAFGLRRKEAIMIRPHEADGGTHLHLEGTWCKGGRPRSVPIRTDFQRQTLEQAKAACGGPGRALIAPGRNYAQQREVYNKQSAQAGIHHPHGLRHAYACTRFRELTGFSAPKEGGPSQQDLTSPQKRLDRQARAQIARELGHNRTRIAADYLDG